MDLRPGDVLTLKKKHPCGSTDCLVLRAGMDFRLRCLGCGHEWLTARGKLEHAVRRVQRKTNEAPH